MNDLSLKGIARRYGNINGGFSVVQDIFRVPRIMGRYSLRSKLESMARTEPGNPKVECMYFWHWGFQQTWTHIKIRIRLSPDPGISNATMNALRTTWRNGIENIWNNKWGCGHSGELTCPLTFEVQWVSNTQHHTVIVRRGPGQSNTSYWHTTDNGRVAAHEFGHYLGHPDEYPEPNCPGRTVYINTIMGQGTDVPARLMTGFANNLGSNVVAI